MSVAGSPLLDGSVLRRLTRLRLGARVVSSSPSSGSGHGHRPGSSREFLGLRPYEVGDDVRDVDWAATLRFDRPYVRVYRREIDASLLLLIDASASMAFGEPEKLAYARALASALGYLGLTNHDRVGAAIFSDGLLACLPVCRGNGHWLRLRSLLADLHGRGASSFDRVPAAMRQAGRHGLTVLISDFLPPEHFEHAFTVLAQYPSTTVAVQLLSPQELDPDVGGDVEMIDVESGEVRRGWIGDHERRGYLAQLADLQARVASMCRTAGIRHVVVSTRVPLLTCLHEHLVSAGVLRLGAS